MYKWLVFKDCELALELWNVGVVKLSLNKISSWPTCVIDNSLCTDLIFLKKLVPCL